jgi:hypothetical protein
MLVLAERLHLDAGSLQEPSPPRRLMGDALARFDY